MGRQNYMTVTVSDNVQEIFDEFVKRKNLTKTAALSDMVELYMLAKDEDLYLELKKKHLNVDGIRDMLADRDSEGADAGYLFMKLRPFEDDAGEWWSVRTLMEFYMDEERKKGYTWFSTESLFFGMSESKVKEYNQNIQDGKSVRILFALNDEEIDNDIAYSADVLQVYSAKLPVACPDMDADSSEKARIWIKMCNVGEETRIRASMLKITSTGRDLKETIRNSQYHFGYVSFK
ncbi:MAG: hypothetical protein IKO14_06670 [Oscillibacter sp.]|nr:hypothetical protein [Oscillibacter sp.]